MKVIKQLRFKFVYSIIIIEMIVFAIILLSLNFAITRRDRIEAADFLYILASNDGHWPEPKHFPKVLPPNEGNRKFIPSPEIFDEIDVTSSASREHPELLIQGFSKTFQKDTHAQLSLRNYFSVLVANDGTIIKVIQDFPLNYTNTEIQNLTTSIISREEQLGLMNGVMFYIKELANTNRLICIVNRSSELKTLNKLYFYSTLLYLISIVLSMLMSIPISKYMVRPAKEAFEKQKQFIADASHELKTPIAVIGANIDVLEGEIKNNKWLQYIKTENIRMGELVKDLLFLAKNDAGRNIVTFSEFDFSNAVENSILPFEVVAFESEKQLTLEVQKDLTCVGDEKSLKQLFIILVDNAIKNSERGAKITVKAYAEGQKIIYKVHNTGSGIQKDELEKIFLRFYRSDSSRVRKTGGYGLGLAIARAIATDHGGTLVADSEVGQWAEFTLTIPRKK